MSRLLKIVRAFIAAEEGASIVEYALLIALIALACLGAISALGNSYQALFNGLSSMLSNTPTSS